MCSRFQPRPSPLRSDCMLFLLLRTMQNVPPASAEPLPYLPAAPLSDRDRQEHHPMDNAYEQLLSSLLEVYQLQYALLATSEGTILATAGSATTLATSDLVQVLCGDQATIQ